MSACAMPTPTPTLNGSLRDDSAISKSWGRAVSDYKTFHDVRAHGGTVRDLPVFPDTYDRQQERQETSQDAKPETNLSTVQQTNASGAAQSEVIINDTVDGNDGPDGSGSGDGSVGYDSNPGLTTAQASGVEGHSLPAQTSDTSTPPVPGLLPPQAVLGGADDSMKKLLMSWYYAGYYTGLYEGERKALQRQQQQPDKVAPRQAAENNIDGSEKAQQ